MSERQFSPKFSAALDLLGRSGVNNFRVGYSDEEDGEPVVWYACGVWPVGAEAAAALDPEVATLRLCDQVVTGGVCTHCGCSTIFDDNPQDSPFDSILNAMGCVYAWDPELRTFRRGCEGDT